MARPRDWRGALPTKLTPTYSQWCRANRYNPETRTYARDRLQDRPRAVPGAHQSRRPLPQEDVTLLHEVEPDPAEKTD